MAALFPFKMGLLIEVSTSSTQGLYGADRTMAGYLGLISREVGTIDGRAL